MRLLRQFQYQVDRFLRKHPRFGIPHLMRYLVIGTALLYLLSRMDRSGTLLSYFMFVPDAVLHGQLWRLVSFVFVPTSSGLLGLVLLLYFQFFIGNILEQTWGTGRFTVYYLLGMLFTILYSVLARLITGQVIWATASYLSMSMFFVFATFWPDNRVLLFFVIPIKIKWLAYAEAALFLISMLIGRTLLPLIAMLTYFLFCGDVLLQRSAPLLQRLGIRFSGSSSSTARRAAQQARRDAKNLPYTRKCAVCGRTDGDHPELEFRYCSQCVGYHCFCEDHIHSHVHFTK